MKNLFTIATFCMLILLSSNLSAMPTPALNYAAEPTPVNLPLNGKYQWQFEVPGSEKQTLTYTFTDSIINIDMTGSTLTRNYNLLVISFDSKTQRIIAKGIDGEKKGIFAAIFLKDIQEKSAVIFKKEFSTREDAETYKVPDADSDDSHGWNKFYRID